MSHPPTYGLLANNIGSKGRQNLDSYPSSFLIIVVESQANYFQNLPEKKEMMITINLGELSKMHVS